MDLVGICITFYLTAEYTLFSNPHGTFSYIDYMIGHKTSLSKFKIEIIPSIFLDPNSMKLEISNRKKTGKIHKDVEIKQHTT